MSSLKERKVDDKEEEELCTFLLPAKTGRSFVAAYGDDETRRKSILHNVGPSCRLSSEDATLLFAFENSSLVLEPTTMRLSYIAVRKQI